MTMSRNLAAQVEGGAAVNVDHAGLGRELEDALDLAAGSSLMRGEQRDEHADRDPVAASSAAASSRAWGLGVRGSLARHAFSSMRGTENGA